MFCMVKVCNISLWRRWLPSPGKARRVCVQVLAPVFVNACSTAGCCNATGAWGWGGAVPQGSSILFSYLMLTVHKPAQERCRWILLDISCSCYKGSVDVLLVLTSASRPAEWNLDLFECAEFCAFTRPLHASCCCTVDRKSLFW